MKIITNASYYGTGSSAVTDLLSEYRGIKALDSNFECRIAYDIFGISDLEYYLSENSHRHNSSVAINMFKRLCGIYGLDKYIRMENYPFYLGENFQKLVENYLNKFIVGTFNGGSHADIYMKSNLKIFGIKMQNYIYNKLHKHKLTIDDSTWATKGVTPYEKEVKKCIYNIAFPCDKFIQYTKEFTNSLFEKFDDGSINYLMVEQLVPPSNTMRYVRYFDGIKVFCVDRDPRDIYYNEKMFWHGGVVPTNPSLFVKWYKATRAHKKTESDDPNIIMRLQFEDLILNYEEVVSELENFLRLDPSSHIDKLSKLDPRKSIRNIGRWKRDSNIYNDIRIIEEGLKEYLAYE